MSDLTPNQLGRMMRLAHRVRREHPGIENWEVAQVIDQILLDETDLPATVCNDLAYALLEGEGEA